MNLNELAQQLVNAGKILDGWSMVPATSGNLSARINDDEIAITVSGIHKGRMTAADIMRVDYSGESLDGNKPSAETVLHTRLYQRFAGTGAVLHVHSICSTLLSRAADNVIVLQDYELLKALPGISTHEASVSLPVFENDQDIPRLADSVDAHIENNTAVPAYLIRGHGFYSWGKTIDDALNYVEALEFMFKCELTTRGDLKV